MHAISDMNYYSTSPVTAPIVSNRNAIMRDIMSARTPKDIEASFPISILTFILFLQMKEREQNATSANSN